MVVLVLIVVVVVVVAVVVVVVYICARLASSVHSASASAICAFLHVASMHTRRCTHTALCALYANLCTPFSSIGVWR